MGLTGPGDGGRGGRTGRFLVRWRRVVLLGTAILLVAAGWYGGDAADRLSAGGFVNPDAESARAEDHLAAMGAGLPNLVLLVRPGPGAHEAATVDTPAVVAAGEAVTARLGREPGIGQVASYWSLGRPAPLRSPAGDSALVVAHASGSEDDIDDTAGRVIEHFDTGDGTRTGAVITVQTAGIAAGYRQASGIVEEDLRTAELIALPITLVLLVLVFRSVVAALTPVLAGVFAIVGTFAVLKALAEVTEVSVYALNLTTALGLGLAIDYSLFVLSRYREERAGGLAPQDAVVRTVATAGRSVVISGATVAVSMAALLLFPMAFLRSFAYAGIPVVALAVLAATGALPALLAVLGDRIDALPVGRRAPRHHGGMAALTGSFWYRIAAGVMRWPVPVGLATTAALIALAVPFLHLTPGLPDDRVLPPSAGTRQVGDELRANYSSQESGSLAVVLPATGALPATRRDAELARYASVVSRLDGVARVDTRTGIYLGGQRVLAPGPATERFDVAGGDWVSVVPAVEPVSPESAALVRTLRATPAPGGSALVAGAGADLLDSIDAVRQRLPWALAIVAGATFVVLLLSFGSLLVPAKALVLNTLSLTATFGAMVWVFQDGNLAELLDFTPTGMLDLTTPILMFCVAFGLSMDYEVFLLSRIREEYARTGDNRAAVPLGLARSARIITAAAATFAVVLLAFATSSITFVKLFGIGLAVAVIVDATIVRALLVPAFMALAGRANWWAPRWLRALHRRIDLGDDRAVTAGTVS
jgi:RND superfamily putative drug exporter